MTCKICRWMEPWGVGVGVGGDAVKAWMSGWKELDRMEEEDKKKGDMLTLMKDHLTDNVVHSRRRAEKDLAIDFKTITRIELKRALSQDLCRCEERER